MLPQNYLTSKPVSQRMNTRKSHNNEFNQSRKSCTVPVFGCDSFRSEANLTRTLQTNAYALAQPSRFVSPEQSYV